MTAAGVDRLVLASSMVVYGEGAYSGPARTGPGPHRGRSPTSMPAASTPSTTRGDPLVPELIDEDAPLDPRNVYAATKLAQEHLVSAWCRATGGAAAALRYHNVYGPGMPQNTPYAGVASLFRSAIERGEAPRVFEDGAQRRDFVHVRRRRLRQPRRDSPGHRAPHPAPSAPSTSAADRCTRSARWPSSSAATRVVLHPIVTGEYRLGDVRHITASSTRLRSELGLDAVGRLRDRDARIRDGAAARRRTLTRLLTRWPLTQRAPTRREPSRASTSSSRASTRRQRCPGCSRACPTATARSWSTTARQTGRPRSPANSAPPWSPNRVADSARRRTPACWRRPRRSSRSATPTRRWTRASS